MSSASAHPRRRPARETSPSMTPSFIDSFHKMNITKGDTFHVAHTADTKLWDPLECKKATSLSMPARSTTCPQSLEDLLIGAGERRAADLLARVDKAIATQSKLALGTVLSEPEVLPVPTFLVNNTTVPEDAVKTHARQHRDSHSSDSGIGSSIADSNDSDFEKIGTGKASPQIPALSFISHADLRIFYPKARNSPASLSPVASASEERGLSSYARQQINLHIVQPILREDYLKEFHSLIKDVPNRIGTKEIKNLRDLEKTLIFLAPDYSRTPTKYLRFCERTIRVLHTTVTTLHESDQRAPTDRPYTQGYFFDLVEQIRRYATILAATREKQAKGEKLDAMDYSPDESVSLQGGVSHNGKPAELVRHKDGKTISIATGLTLSADEVAAASMKRPMSHDVDEDDEVLRSMARRKKNAKPEIHTCPEPNCDKEFKRPCDLTKHVKTHERPWKCSEKTCRYATEGWPTEKERDRHVNDKHSTTPSLYHCLYKPCPYTSKRESNCKQHMEKAHGWNYIRSKNNGKGRATDVTRLPRGSVPASPSSAMLTPLTPIAPSPSVSTQSWVSSRPGSMAPPPSMPSHYGTPAFVQPSPDFTGHFNMDNFDFNNMADYPMTPALSDDRHTSSSASSHAGLNLDGSAYNSAFSPDDFTFDTSFDFNSFAYQQQPTPNSASMPPSGSFSSHAHPPNMDVTMYYGQASAGAQADPTFTPENFDDMNMSMDDGMGGDCMAPDADFTLFSSAPAPTSNAEMFQSLAEGSWGKFGSQFHPNTTAPRIPTDSSALADLFPELAN